MLAMSDLMFETSMLDKQQCVDILTGFDKAVDYETMLMARLMVRLSHHGMSSGMLALG